MLDPVEFEGIEQLERAIRQLPEGLVVRVYGDATNAMARVVAKTAQSEVPVRTGALRNSIRVRRIGERYRGRRIPGAAANVFVGGPGAFHAHLVELGTRRAAANPFLRRSISQKQAVQHREFARAAARSLERLTRQLATGTVPASVIRLI